MLKGNFRIQALLVQKTWVFQVGLEAGATARDVKKKLSEAMQAVIQHSHLHSQKTEGEE